MSLHSTTRLPTIDQSKKRKTNYHTITCVPLKNHQPDRQKKKKTRDDGYNLLNIYKKISCSYFVGHSARDDQNNMKIF